jgi:hypothetical protein
MDKIDINDTYLLALCLDAHSITAATPEHFLLL